MDLLKVRSITLIYLGCCIICVGQIRLISQSNLLEAHPDVDPTRIRFTDLHAWFVCALPDFKDDPNKSTEVFGFEAIQMALVG